MLLVIFSLSLDSYLMTQDVILGVRSKNPNFLGIFSYKLNWIYFEHLFMRKSKGSFLPLLLIGMSM